MKVELDRVSGAPGQIVTVDSHTAGEPTRLVVAGLPPLPGATVNDRRLYMREHLDDVRLLLTTEPRGHRDMFGAVLTEPVTPGAAFGLIFMDARRYPYMCGHGTIGAVTTMLELGGVPVPSDAETCTVIVDTPSGPVRAFATLDRSAGEVRVSSVAIQLESAFVHASDQRLDVPGLGTLRVDLVCVGGYFAMVTADQIDLRLVAAEAPALAEAGMAIIDAANRELTVQHPEHPYVNTIDVTEFHVLDAPGQSRNAVVYGEAHVDRSPCGTGTSAKMALLFHQGKMEVGDSLVNTGLLGTTFTGRIVAETAVGPFAAIVPEIRGQAHLTGLHRFIVRDDDPFPRGFLF